MSEDDLPVYIEPKEIARMAGWSILRAKRAAKADGIAVHRGGPKSRVLLPRVKVKEHWPEVYEAWLDRRMANRSGT